MKNALLVARLLLALPYLVFGLNYYFQFFEGPAPAGPAGDFAMAMAKTGYMFPLIKGTEVAGGVLLLLGQFVPFALLILAPITINIVAFHAYLDPSMPGMGIAIALAVLHLFVAAGYGDAFRQVMRRVPAERR